MSPSYWAGSPERVWNSDFSDTRSKDAAQPVHNSTYECLNLMPWIHIEGDPRAGAKLTNDDSDEIGIVVGLKVEYENVSGIRQGHAEISIFITDIDGFAEALGFGNV